MAPPGTGGALDRLLAVRDRLLADPRFQTRAARNPLTRWIARRRARTLFDICAGFVYSQVLQAGVRLRLFEILAEGPASLPVLADRLGLPVDAARRLLDASAALDLAEKRRGGRYGLGPLGAALVGNPGIAAMVEHHALLYGDLADPVALLRGERAQTGLGGYWPYAAGQGHAAAAGAEDVAAYSELMASSQAMIAGDILDAAPLGRYRHLLDVGGGQGAFVRAALERTPGLTATLFDLPAVAERARERLDADGLGSRACAVGGDFLADPLPEGADIASLVRVVHDHDDPVALAILKGVRRALPPGGTLLVAEPMAETPGAEPVGAYFLFYLMAMGSGRPRSATELKSLLETAGFVAIRPVPTHRPLLTRLLVARVPDKPA
ncbi:MAG: methyltransferase [Azospirillaceae bacterium]